MGVGFLAGSLLAAPLEQRTAFLAAAVLLAAGGALGLAAPQARGEVDVSSDAQATALSAPAGVVAGDRR